MGLKIRRDTAATWTSVDPTLEQAEQGYETDTGKWKFGDGVTAWTSLPYSALGDVTGPGSTVDSEIVLWSGTSGDDLKRATGSGLVKATSGVYGTVAAPSGAVVGTTDTQVLTNKDLTSGTNTFPAAAAAWGSITGTLSAQTDLDTALAAKLAIANNLSDLTDPTTARWNLKTPAQTRCIVVSVANQTLSGTVTIDGVALVANNRVLLTAQTAPAENGIWQVQAGAWTRPADFPSGGVTQAVSVLVAGGVGGSNYSGSVWVMTHTGNLTIDSGSQTWDTSNRTAPQTLHNKTMSSSATGATQSPGDNSTKLATTAYADAAVALKQPLDSDLTTLAGLTATTDSFIQSKSSAWASRTVAQVKTDLGLTGTNSGDQTVTLTGDVTGTGTGTFAATVANDAVTYAKMQNVSATDKLLGRSTAGAGDVEEITLTAAGRALIDDAAAVNQRTTLGLVIGTDVVAPNQDTTGKSAKTDALNSATTVVNVAAATAPTSGQVLTATSGTAATWQTPTGGGGTWGTITGTLSAQTDLDTALSGKQPLDSDLTTIAGLTATTDNFMVAAASAWASRTPAQVKTTLAIAESDVASLVSDLALKAPLASPSFTGTTTIGSLAGILKGTAGAVSAATAGTDYTTPTSTETQTNKRRTPRVYNTTSTATLTPEIDTYDAFFLTAQAAALNIANHSTSTPTDFEKIEIRIIDNGTARAITYGTNFDGTSKAGIALPSTTVISKYLEMGFEWWAGALNKYVLVFVAFGA